MSSVLSCLPFSNRPVPCDPMMNPKAKIYASIVKREKFLRSVSSLRSDLRLKF